MAQVLKTGRELDELLADIGKIPGWRVKTDAVRATIHPPSGQGTPFHVYRRAVNDKQACAEMYRNLRHRGWSSELQTSAANADAAIRSAIDVAEAEMPPAPTLIIEIVDTGPEPSAGDLEKRLVHPRLAYPDALTGVVARHWKLTEHANLRINTRGIHVGEVLACLDAGVRIESRDDNNRPCWMYQRGDVRVITSLNGNRIVSVMDRNAEQRKKLGIPRQPQLPPPGFLTGTPDIVDDHEESDPVNALRRAGRVVAARPKFVSAADRWTAFAAQRRFTAGDTVDRADWMDYVSAAVAAADPHHYPGYRAKCERAASGYWVQLGRDKGVLAYTGTTGRWAFSADPVEVKHQIMPYVEAREQDISVPETVIVTGKLTSGGPFLDAFIAALGPGKKFKLKDVEDALIAFHQASGTAMPTVSAVNQTCARFASMVPPKIGRVVSGLYYTLGHSPADVDVADAPAALPVSEATEPAVAAPRIPAARVSFDDDDVEPVNQQVPAVSWEPVAVVEPAVEELVLALVTHSTIGAVEQELKDGAARYGPRYATIGDPFDLGDSDYDVEVSKGTDGRYRLRARYTG